MAPPLPTIVNVTDPNDKHLTVLLGFSKYLFRGFERNNVQMTGSWYIDDADQQALELADAIEKLRPKFVNLIGTSKSCTGAFILSHLLAARFPKIHFRIFSFSAYTSLEEQYYQQRNLLHVIPESLKELWNDPVRWKKATRFIEAADLIQHRNVKAYFVFPSLSRGPEPDAAQRLRHLPNVVLIPLRVRVHSVIFPFWKFVTPDAKVETFEGVRPAALKPAIYSYFHAMQTDPWYRFSIYTLLFETSRFRKEMSRFNASFKALGGSESGHEPASIPVA